MSDASDRGNELHETDDIKGGDNGLEELEPTLPASRVNFPRIRPANGRVSRFRASMDSRRVTAVIIFLVLVGVLAALVVHNLPPNVRYTRAIVGNLTVSFPTSGVLQAGVYGANFVEPGKLAEIDVTVGDLVTQGEVLAKLDSKLLNDAVNSAQSAVDGAQTELSDAQATQAAVTAQSSSNLAAALDKEQAAIAACQSDSTCIQTAEDAYSSAQSTADSANQQAQAMVDSAQASLATAESQLQAAQDAQTGATLKASHAGTVVSIDGAVGDTVGGAGTTFIKLVDLDQIQVQASVSVARVSEVTSSTVFRLVVPALGKQQFGGTLVGVTPVGEQIHGVLSYPVLIQVDMQSTNGANLLPGMNADVQVITQQRTAVLLISASAVSFAQAAGNPHLGGFLTQKQVLSAERKAKQALMSLENSGLVTSADNPTASYVLNYAKGRWIIVPVVIGLTDGHVYEVLAGLKAGDQIVAGEVGGAVTIPTATQPVTR